MAPRSTWKGFVKLSLVSVPVRAYTANNTTEEIRLNQLHNECNSRVKYQKICPEHGVLKSTDIVSGYEFTKDQYVVIDPQEIAKLRSESDKSINIDGFVDPKEIDPIYLAGKTYFLLPDGPAGKRPYALLVRGMTEGKVIGIAQIIISGREQLVALRPDGDMLVMSILNYAKKVKAIDEFREELEEQEMTKEELALAQTLISASILEKFNFDKYEDDYVKNLSKLIEMKVAGEEIVQAPDLEEPKIINLMDALKKSVAAAQSSSGKKMAESVKDTGEKKASRTSAKKVQRKKKSG